MFGVNMIHGDFEHIVAADADAMNQYGRFFPRFCGRVVRVLRLLRLGHDGILSRSL